MKYIKKSFLVLSLLSFFSLSSFSANACTVKVGDFDWDSANIHTAIGSYIMEHGYGCDVEVTKGSTNPILAALIDNQLDIIFEHWTDNNVALIDPELASGNLVDLGINTPASEQAFFVDRAVGIKLIDFKVEFGLTHESDKTQIVLADEISPDTCRLWDKITEKKLDKDRFRKDLGDLIPAYSEVAKRLGILHEQSNVSAVNVTKLSSVKRKRK